MSGYTDGIGIGIGIGAIRCIFADERVRIVDLPELRLLDPEALRFVEGSGIETVGVVAGASNAGLAARAARDLLAEMDSEPSVLLMVAPRAPDVLLGSDVCEVQAQAKLAATFSLTVDGLGCTGSSVAWALARDMLVADPGRDSVLIVHASLPAGADRVRYPVTVVGDGAYAMTMVRGGRPALVAHRAATDGSFHDLFRIDYKRAPWYEWREECESPDRYRFELAMQSRLRLSGLVDEVLADAGIDRGQIKTVVMQNVTASAYTFYESLLGLTIHPVCGEHLARYGHLGAMDVVANLARLIDSGECVAGDHVLVLNNSPVAAWAVSLWEF